MKLHYMGNYSGNPDDLPYIDHEPGAVPFKEPKSNMAIAIIANGIALVIMILLLGVMNARTGYIEVSFLGAALAILTLIPHELLHAVCFRGDVYMYTNISKGMLFITGPERMSKARFIFTGMLPNIIFGLVPFALYLINPGWKLLGTMGALCISFGAGDYINIFNALTQMPKGSWAYFYKFKTYWYMPEE